jgi:hypothetical protein
LQAGVTLPALAQQSAPIGTANTIGSVSNSNAGSTANGTGAASAASAGPTRVLLLPNGTRRTPSISTVTVCDFTDFTGAFPDVVDVCRLR